MHGDCRKKGFKFFVIAILGVLLFTYLFMVLWNLLIPDLFGGPSISYLQGLGLLALAKIVLGFGKWGHHWHGHHWHSKYHHQWKDKVKQRMANMSEEEKEHFKKSMRNWCSRRPFSDGASEEDKEN